MVLKKEITIRIKDLLQKNPQGLSITDIVKAVKINRNTAGRYLENLLVSGQVDMRRFGMAKIYMLSQRVPLSAVLSISSELVIQLDSSLRIIFANEPFLKLVRTDNKNLIGKNIEYTPVALVFNESFTGFIENIREGITGKEWSGDIALTTKDIILFCRIAPTVFDDGRKGVSIIFEDITKRKQAELKVEESERQFRLLAENSLDMIGRIKPDYTHIYASPAYTTTLGYLPEELIGKKGRLFIHPDDVPIMESAGNILTEQNSSATVRFRSKHKDGHYIWIESHVRAIFDEKTHELSEHYTVSRDITERKTAEEALQESEDRYRKLVEISPDAVFLHREGRIIYANPAAFTLLGASHSDEIIGKNVLDIIHPEFRDTIRKNIEKDLGGDITPPMELHMLRVDGTSIIVEGRGVKTNIDGKPAVQVAIRDITERKRVEEALRESEEKYRTFVDRANDVICVIQDGIVKICNPRLPEFWGGSVEEIQGKPFINFIHPDALSEIIDRYNRRMAGENPPSIYQTILKRRNGSRSFVELNAGIISYEGKPADLVIIRDINERKKAEEALRESEATARALMNAPTDSVILMDKQGVILALNETAAVRFGRRADELIGILTDDLLPKEVAQSRRALVTQVLETKKMVRFEDERDGIRYDTVAYPITSGTGEVIKIAIVAREIIERSLFRRPYP
ncbi:MAG: PAS domain S-box protein [Methanoregula sp.]|jgi:PAS domain S-box-containing protein|nr:PAS domain S-box protein [Methanoregula sp.]